MAPNPYLFIGIMTGHALLLKTALYFDAPKVGPAARGAGVEARRVGAVPEAQVPVEVAALRLAGCAPASNRYPE